METKAVRIIIFGKVQQVGFRYFVYRLATEIGVNGFVKNQSDKSVYVEVEGDTHKIDVFIEHCKMGPPHSQVSKFQVKSIPSQEFREFTIR